MARKHTPAVSGAAAVTRGRTVPIPETIEAVKGYGTLTIYRMAASPFWYARFYEDNAVHRRSTKTGDKRDAIKAAKAFFVTLKSKKVNKLPLTKKSGFEVCARGLQKENEARVARGELAQTKTKNDSLRLENDLMPYFGKYEIAEIDYSAISAYVASICTPDRSLSTNTLKIHLSHVKTILKYAQRAGVITSLPAFPAMKTVDNPRSWFSADEYNKLHNTARGNIGKTFPGVGSKGEQKRNVTLTQELYDLILFMTGTFARPTDIKVLRHKHVAVERTGGGFLRLTHPPTKNHSGQMISLPATVQIYERLSNRQSASGFGKPEDFLFQPERPDNRDYAMRVLTRQFDQLLRMTNLKTTPSGDRRTLYSLRHTAIMLRLINADGLNPLTLARNARTSVEMIDRFYARHLTAEMNLAQLHSGLPESRSHKNAAVASPSDFANRPDVRIDEA